MLSTTSATTRGAVELFDLAPLFLQRTTKRQELPTLPDVLLKHALDSLSLSGATSVVLPASVITDVLRMPSSSSSAVTVSSSVFHIQCESDLKHVLDAARQHYASSSSSSASLRVLIDWPLGDVGSSMQYERRFVDISQERDAWLEACNDSGLIDVLGWLRSALGCKFEGNNVKSIAVGESTNRLLSLGCSTVFLEEGCSTLTPKWLEVALKTHAAISPNSLGQLALSLSGNEETSVAVVSMALLRGVTKFAGSSHGGVTSLPLLRRTSVNGNYQFVPPYIGAAGLTDQRLRMDDLLQAVLTFKDQHGGGVSEEELIQLSHSQKYCQSFTASL